LAKKHRQVLDRLDPVAVARYQITENDIRAIERYVNIIQADLRGVSIWQEIQDFPGAYATSLVIHEIVEIRLLQARGIDPFKLDTETLQLTLTGNVDAHIQAIYDEHSVIIFRNISLVSTNSFFKSAHCSRSTEKMTWKPIFNYCLKVTLGSSL
jgi:hypothetical protein